MAEYLGNTHVLIQRALDEGKNAFLLSRVQLDQVLSICYQLIEAKNDLVRENFELRSRITVLEQSQIPQPTEAHDVS